MKKKIVLLLLTFLGVAAVLLMQGNSAIGCDKKCQATCPLSGKKMVKELPVEYNDYEFDYCQFPLPFVNS